MSRPLLSATNFCTSTFCRVLLQRLDDRLGDFDRVGQNHADALRPFQQFDDHRRTAHPLDGRQHVLLVADKRGLRNADVMPAENLQRPQLVARIGDSGRRVRTEHIHLLELPNHGRTEIA